MDGRKILHLDMDAFFASIEQRDRPELRGKPVVVGHARTARGVVAAASYEARRYGIHSAMPMARAWRLCPSLKVVRGDFARYRAASAQMRAILEEYSELIEPLSIDECYLDVTDDVKGLGSATETAEELRKRIKAEIGVTASVGAGPSKLVAKLASDHNKPDGTTIVAPARVRAFLDPLPVGRIWGIGPKSVERLHRIGIVTVGELARVPSGEALARLGRRGPDWVRLARGEDERPVRPSRARKRRGLERTFTEDVRGPEAIERVVFAQLEALAQRLAEAGERARQFTLKIRYEDFSTVTRSFSLAVPTARPDLCVAQVRAVLARTEIERRAVRLLGVSAGELERDGEPGSQLALTL